MEESDYLTHNELSIEGDIKFQHIVDIEIKREINEHTELTVVGIIDEKDKDTYLDNIKYGSEISLKYGKEITEVLFGGIIVDVEIIERKRIYYAIIKANSATWIMDQKLKKRSFNKDTITYDDILNVIKKDYEKCDFISDDKFNQKVEKLIVQYNETDFEFLKRIASHLGLVIVPEDLYNMPRCFVGIRTRNSIELKEESYELTRHFDDFTGEKYGYKLISGEFLEVGCEVVLSNERFVVIKCKSKLINSELTNTYTILESRLTEVSKICNEKIRGAALEGVVIEPKGSQAKVQLNIDNEDVTNWYDVIVGSNNALYSMPYAGDKVKVYFPSDEEEEAQISFTTYNGTGLNPDTKFWSNRDGKKIEYTKQTIEFSAKSGTLDSSKEHSIKLTDSSGIDIKSDLKITIMSAGSLSLNAKSISIVGKQGVSLNHYPNAKEKNTGIPKGITIDSTEVSFKVEDAYFEGKEKKAYPIEADPEPSFSEAPKPKVTQQTSQTQKYTLKNKNEERVESGWKTFAKGLGIALLAVGMAVAVVATGGAALAVAAPLLAGGLFSTALGVGVVATAVVGTTMGLVGATMEGNVAEATMEEGYNEVQNGKNGTDEKGFNRIRDGEFGGDEEKYQQYQDQAVGLWSSGVMLNMTAMSLGTELAPAAVMADGMFYSKVSTTLSEEETILANNPLIDGRSKVGIYDEFNKIKDPKERYEYLLDKAKTTDVSTEKNKAIFYAGRVETKDGMVTARKMAETYADQLYKEKGIVKLTLERTPGAKWMDDLKLYNETSSGVPKYEELGLTRKQTDEIWRTLSSRYADGTSGSVTAFTKNVPDLWKPKTIFWSTELPQLRRNTNVTHINIR